MAEASEEDRQKLIKLIQEGRMEFAPAGKKYFERARVIEIGDKADFTVVDAEVTHFWGPWERKEEDGTVKGSKGGIEISWSTVSAGFGSLTVVLTNDGKLKADTETMGKDFCKAVFAKLVDSWEEEE